MIQRENIVRVGRAKGECNYFFINNILNIYYKNVFDV